MMHWPMARLQQRAWMSRHRSHCPLTTPCSPSRTAVSGQLGNRVPTLLQQPVLWVLWVPMAGDPLAGVTRIPRPR